MSSIAEVKGRTRRRSWPIWLALILSLTLNVCFIGGLVWSRFVIHRLHTPAERLAELGQSLNLSPVQQADYHHFIHALRQRTHLLQESNTPLLDRIWAELSKPTPDQALVSRLTAQAAENRQLYQHDTSAALTTFMTTLTPEQRATLAAFAEHRHDFVSRRLFWLAIP